ncbi:DUF3006 domain-containing protein [Clostridium sp. CX1]|uniref:DUF3006 domain-containing protein n=1 Tax=Clostridium tanneri TaxID=3037988 RepID=A0ABU4JWB1_9CLOT|nr:MULTISPECIES: DUF3006 domain-containing protein [unclassified Clostridium]MCT8975728.1 DUF3006 domain-containing protein [Clostridium sp. CX1]MDW8802445.1 DUF3006 domain-containing protein [Clostridium sp. A1-XYC3]
MLGKIIDINLSDASVNFHDGRTINIDIYQLPAGVRVGDTVNIQTGSMRMVNYNSAHLF